MPAKPQTMMDLLRKDASLPKDDEKPVVKEQEKEEEGEEEQQQEEEQEEEEEQNEDVQEEGQEEDNEEEDGPLTRSNKKDGKKPKPVQIRELRASRDEWKTKARDLESKVKLLEKSSSEEGSSILSLVEEKFGIGPDAKEKIEGLLSVAEEKDRIEKEYNDFKRKIDITSTKEWDEEYAQPYKDSAESFYATIVNTDSDGSIPNEQIFQVFANQLATGALKKGSISATEVKSAIDKFADLYEKETGEEYIKPNIGEVTSSIRSVLSLNKKQAEAFEKWESESKSRRENSKIAENEKSERLKAIEKRERRGFAQKALESFPIDDIEEVLEGIDITDEFNSVFSKNEDQIADPSKALSYDELISTMVKGRLFDELWKKYNENLSEKEIKKQANRGVKGSDRIPSHDPKKNNRPAPGQASWLPEEKSFGMKR